MLLSFILRDSNYKLAQFEEEKIRALESRILAKYALGKNTAGKYQRWWREIEEK